MVRVSSRRALLVGIALALAAVVTLPLCTQVVDFSWLTADGKLPSGASLTAPEQQSGKPGQATNAALKAPDRNTDRPPGAVPDKPVPLPAAQKDIQRQHVTPKVTQHSTVPTIDPKAVERPRDRTATTETFDNPNGTHTIRVYDQPANVKMPDGSWQHIDPTLVPAGDRLKPKATAQNLSVAAKADDAELVQLAFDDKHTMAYGLADAAKVAAKTNGSTVTYPAALPGVDLKLQATSTGVQEDLLLTTAQAPTSYSYRLALTNLTPQLTADGAVELRDGAKVIGVIPAGTAKDANNASGAVRYTLAKAGNAWTLGVTLDANWLHDPARAFPVDIDPSAGQYNATDDMYVKSNGAVDSMGEILQTGYVDGALARSYLHFGLGDLGNKYILGGTLNLWAVGTTTCSPRTVNVYEATAGWNTGQRWPGAQVGRQLASGTFAHGAAGCSDPAAEGLQFDADVLTDWTHGTAMGNGISLRAADESDRNGMRFASANAQKAENRPFLDVLYSDEGAAFQATDVLQPTANRAGSVTARITNRGSTTWTPSNGWDFGYIIQPGNYVSNGTAVPNDVAPGQSVTMTIPLYALPPGRYQVFLTMWTPSKQDFFVAYRVPYGVFDLDVTNVKPTVDYEQPATPATVQSLTPTLYAEGIDPDNWPAKGLTYKFRLCTDAALTQNCVESPWGAQTWSPPAGALSWTRNYYWGVKSDDTVDASPNWTVLQLTPQVPQPEITSHLAGVPDAAQATGLDPQVGNYTLENTDASVDTVGPDLTIGRTYNSLDPRRDTAFGIGWASRVDMKLAKDNDGSGNVVLTYPTGRQLRFGLNPDGSYGSPAGESTVLVHNTGGGLAYHTLKDSTGTQWQFDAAQHLVAIIDPAGLQETLTYDGNDHVSTITNSTSGRTLTLTWTGSHVTSVATQAPSLGGTPLVWKYNYTGDQLNSVCAPGAAPNCTTYTYQPGSHYRSSVADDNPAAYWRLDERDNTTFGSAVTWHQGGESAAGHGVIVGSQGAIGGTGDTAATFDGASSYVTLPDKLATTSMSMAAELWFRTTGSGTLMSLQDQGFPAGTPTRATPVLYVGTDGFLYGGFPMRDTGGARQVVTTQQVNDGNWHHAVLSTAINSQTLYLDGQAVGTPITGLIDARAQTTAVLGAGRGQGWPATNNGNFYFQGDIDEAAFYQHSLGALAAADHYRAAQAGIELKSVTLPQDSTRVYATMTYDDINDRVATLVDHAGLKWTVDPPKITSAQLKDQNGNPYWGNVTRTATLHGPQGYGDWTYTYDVVNGGRLMTTSHNGHGTSREYNTAGFLSATVDENNNRVEQTTDERGNVLSRKACRAANSCNTSYFTYIAPANPLDPRGNRIASKSDARSSGPTDTSYRTTFDYDTAGRLKTITEPVPVGQTTRPTTVNFYSDGTQPAADNQTVPAGLLLTTTGPRGELTTNRYNHNGDLAETISPTKLHTTRTTDDIGRTTRTTTLNDGGAVFASTTYTYDGRSQIATATGQPVQNLITGVTHTPITTYGYDGDGNVTSVALGDTLPVSQGGDAPRSTSYVYDAHDRVQQKTLSDGGIEKVRFSPDNLSVTTTDVRGFDWTTISDELGHELTTVVSGAGVDPQDPNATSMTVATKAYDPGGRLTVSTDAMGRTTTYGYWGDNLLATVTAKNYDASRDLVLEQRSYDPAGNLTQDVAAGGVTTTSTFDPAGNVASTTLDPAGLNRTTSYTRDLDGNQLTVSRTGAADPTRTEFTQFGYDNGNQVVRSDDRLDANTLVSTTVIRDERGLPTTVTDGRQLPTLYSYDGTGQLVSTTTPAADVWRAGKVTPDVRGVTTVGRNAFGEVTQSKDPAGNVTTTARDGLGRATDGTLPDYTPPGSSTPITATTHTDYDHAGNALKVTDPLKRVTVNTYDPYGNVLTTTLPQVGDTPSVVANTYDRAGELLSTTDPSGARKQFTYDTLGQRRTTTDVDRSSGQTLYYTTTTGYDDAGNPTTVTTPQNNTTTTDFDPAGMPKKVTDPTNRSTTTSYDIAGRPATVTDPTGLVTTTGYDLLGRAVRTSQSSNGKELRASTTGYDGNGNVASTTTAEGRLTTFGHDSLNRVSQQVTKVDATHSITTTVGYDALGNKAHVVDGDGHATEFTYNAWGLAESTIDPATAAAPTLADRTRTTIYDAAQQAVTRTEPGGIVRTSSFDAQGRVYQQTGTGAEASTSDRTVGYDLAGRITKVGGPGGDTIYTYDDRGNVLTYQGPATSGSYTYYGDGTMESRKDTTGTTKYGYDKADRLAWVTDPVTGRTMDYGYNSGGQLNSITDRAVAQNTQRVIGYDPLGRLASDQLQQSPDGSTQITRLGETYGYDLDDNLKSRSDLTVGKSADNSYSYDGAGRLSSWTDPTSKTTSYGWDDAGNRTSVGGQTFSYDERNELLSGNGSTYAYTARGTLKSTTSNGNTSAATFDAFDRQITSGAMQYQYDSLDRVATRNGTAFGYDGLSNNVVTDGNRVVSRLPDGTPLSDKAVGATAGKSLFTNQHGDVVGRYLGGATDGLRGYDPFGTVTASSGDTSALGFQGSWTDSGTGQVDMGARWYSPASGQFTSRDSWNTAAGNRFGYGDTDPLDGTDPTGHHWTPLICGPDYDHIPDSWLDAFTSALESIARQFTGTSECTPATVAGCGDSMRDSQGYACPDQIRYDWAHDPCAHSNSYHCNPRDGYHSGGPGQPGTHGTPGTPGTHGKPSSPGGRGGGRPVVKHRPLPPPPPLWFVNVHKREHRQAPGDTVKPRPPKYWIDPPADHIVDPGPELTKNSNKTTLSGPVSVFDAPQADANYDYRSDEDACLNGDLPHTIWYGPLQRVTDDKNNGIGNRATGAAACLTMVQTGTRGKEDHPMDGRDSNNKCAEAAGHLIAWCFYGADDAANLVPLNQNKTNSSRMYHAVEKQVKKQIEENKGPIYYRVTPHFPDGQLVPDYLDVIAQGRNFDCETRIYNSPNAIPGYRGCRDAVVK